MRPPSVGRADPGAAVGLQQRRQGARHHDDVRIEEIERRLAVVALAAVAQDARRRRRPRSKTVLLAVRVPASTPSSCERIRHELALADGQARVADLAAAAVVARDLLESGDDVAVGKLPQAAIERPAAELAVVAIDDAVIAVVQAQRRQEAGWSGHRRGVARASRDCGRRSLASIASRPRSIDARGPSATPVSSGGTAAIPRLRKRSGVTVRRGVERSEGRGERSRPDAVRLDTVTTHGTWSRLLPG